MKGSVIKAPLNTILPSFMPVIFERAIPGYAATPLIAGEKRIAPGSLRPLLIASAFVGTSNHAVDRGFELDAVERILRQSIDAIHGVAPEEAEKARVLIDQFLNFPIFRADHNLDDWLCEALWPTFQTIEYRYPSAMSEAMADAVGIGEVLGRLELAY